MKKIILTAFMLIGLAFSSDAQTFSKNALGLRLGDNDGFGGEISYQRGLSKNTIDNYSFDIERLCLFLDENRIEVSPIKISEETIQQFIYSVSKEVNPRSQARIISGLKSFFSYFYNE